MFTALRQRAPGHSLGRIAWWYLLHFLCYLYFAPLHRYRCWGVHHIPRTGPVLLVSNHQSYFDPILVGLGGHHRQPYAMARSTLWDVKILDQIITSMNAIPVEQGTADFTSLRQCIGVLKDDHALLIFPEGERTATGETQPFATGTMLLIKRAKPVVVPVAIEGAYHVFPRHARVPHPGGRIGVMYGEPIAAEALIAMKGDAPLDLLRDRIDTMRATIRDRIDL